MSELLIANLNTELLDGAFTICSSEWAANGREIYNNPFSRIYYVDSGSGLVSFLSGRIFELQPAKLYCIPARSPARYRAIEEMRLYWIHFTANLFGCMELFTTLKLNLTCDVQNEKEIIALFKKLLSICKSPNLNDRFICDGMLRMLIANFADLRKESAPEKLNDIQRLLPAVRYIEKNLTRKIKLQELADTVSLQAAYFCSLFSAVFGQSPVEYINRKRVEMAQFLLMKTNMSIKEIAYESGFKDPYYFSRVFRKLCTIPPMRYRAQKDKPV